MRAAVAARRAPARRATHATRTVPAAGRSIAPPRLAQRQRQAVATRAEEATGRIARAHAAATKPLQVPLQDILAAFGAFQDEAETEASKAADRDALQSQAADFAQQAGTHMGRFANQALNIAQAGQMLAGHAGAHDATSLLQAAADPLQPYGVIGSFDQVPTDALNAMVGRASNGTPLANLFSGIGAEAEQNVNRTLQTGILTGLNPNVVARQIAQDLNIPYYRATAIARTEMLGAYRDAALRTYQANSDVVNGWMWMCAQSANTCAACMFMDGSIHPLSEAMDDCHVNCRCTMVPLTNSYADILSNAGIDTSGMSLPDSAFDPAQRLSGADWFAQQSAEVQASILGSKAAQEAYAAREVGLGDFLGVRHDARWGDSIYAKSLREALTRQINPEVIERIRTEGGAAADELAAEFGHFRDAAAAEFDAALGTGETAATDLGDLSGDIRPLGRSGRPMTVEEAQANLDAAHATEDRARAMWRAAAPGSEERSAAAELIWRAQRNVLEAEGRLDEARGGFGYAVRYHTPAARDALTTLLGPDAEARIGPMTGAGYADRVTVLVQPDGAVTLEREGRAIQAGTGRADITLWRLDGAAAAAQGLQEGSLVAEVGLVRSDEKAVASGLDVLDSMQAMRDAGVARVTAWAEGSLANEYMNGYWTWARMGAEGDIPENLLAAAQARFGSDITRVEQIMDLPSGAAWWKANGETFHATLDLTPGGRTAQRLDELQARLAAREGDIRPLARGARAPAPASLPAVRPSVPTEAEMREGAAHGIFSARDVRGDPVPRLAREVAARLGSDPDFQALAARLREIGSGIRSDRDVVRILLGGYHAGFVGEDASPLVVALQEAARAEFGLGDAMAVGNTRLQAQAERMFGDVMPGLRVYLRDMYEQTQAYFRERGISEVTLWRGMGWSARARPADIVWDGAVREMRVPVQPFAAFSTDPAVSINYVDQGRYVMMTAQSVPVERILSVPMTGFGMPSEREVVVLGGQFDVLGEAKVAARGARDAADLFTPDVVYRDFAAAGERAAGEAPAATIERANADLKAAKAQLAAATRDRKAAERAIARDTTKAADPASTPKMVAAAEKRIAANEAKLADLRASEAAAQRDVDEAKAAVARAKADARAAEKAAKQAARDAEKAAKMPATMASEQGAGVSERLSTDVYRGSSLPSEEARLTDRANLDTRETDETQAKAQKRNAQALGQALKDNPDYQALAAKLDPAKVLKPDPEGGSPKLVARADPNRAAAKLLKTWAAYNPSVSSAAEARLWAAMQVAIRDEFGIDAQVAVDAKLLSAAEREYAAVMPGLRAYVRQMYEDTQRWLADRGIVDLPIYRGMVLRPGAELADLPLDGEFHPAEMALSPASSFSASMGSAGGFALGGEEDVQAVIAARVPAERVLSVGATGFGTKSEAEVIVLGGTDDRVLVAGTRGLDLAEQTEAEWLPNMYASLERASTAEGAAVEADIRLSDDLRPLASRPVGSSEPARRAFEALPNTDGIAAQLQDRHDGLTAYFGMLPADTANAIAETFDAIAERWPEMADRLGYLGLDMGPDALEHAGRLAQLDANVYAGADPNGRFVLLNTLKLADPDAMLRSIAEDIAEGYLPAGADRLEFVVAHEMGHVFEAWVRTDAERAAALDAFMASHVDLTASLGDIAGRDPAEAFATAWAARELGILGDDAYVQAQADFLDQLLTDHPGTGDAMPFPGKGSDRPGLRPLASGEPPEPLPARERLTPDEARAQLPDAQREAFEAWSELSALERSYGAAQRDPTLLEQFHRDYAAAQSRHDEAVGRVYRLQSFIAGHASVRFESPEIGQRLEAIFGHPMSDQEIGDLFGAHPGDVIEAHADISRLSYGLPGPLPNPSIAQEVVFHLYTATEEQEMVLFRGANGPELYAIYARNLTQKSAGTGREIIDALQHMADAGIVRITAGAARSLPYAESEWNGYYTWARLGFQGDIPPRVLRYAQARFGPDVTRVEQLMVLPGGPQWWKAHGYQWTGSFDFAPGSYSMRVFTRWKRIVERAGGGA